MEIQADFSGDYLQLVRFINSLERDPLFFIIDSVELGGEQGGRGQAAIETGDLSEGERLMQLGTEDRNKTIAAVALAVIGPGSTGRAPCSQLPGIREISHSGRGPRGRDPHPGARPDRGGRTGGGRKKAMRRLPVRSIRPCATTG